MKYTFFLPPRRVGLAFFQALSSFHEHLEENQRSVNRQYECPRNQIVVVEFEPRQEKTVFEVCDQVRLKPACSADQSS